MVKSFEEKNPSNNYIPVFNVNGPIKIRTIYEIDKEIHLYC